MVPKIVATLFLFFIIINGVELRLYYVEVEKPLPRTDFSIINILRRLNQKIYVLQKDV